MGLSVRGYDESLREAWNAFNLQHPHGTFFHRIEWRGLVNEVFGHEPRHLVALRDGQLAGILPLFHVRSRLFGNGLCSSPFCVYGGAIGDEEAVRELEDAAAAAARGLGVAHLELRNRDHARGDWPTKTLYVTFRKPIAPDLDANMKAIPRKQRAMVRKGIDGGLQSAIDPAIDRFFPIYATSVRNHGTPVFTRRYFASLRDVFGEDCEIVTVSSGGEPVASVMNFYFRDEVLPYYGGGTPRAREVKAFDFMYWEVMRRACERGLRIFDYGRSKVDSGSWSFKKNWGFEPLPLPYQYHLVTADRVPEVNPNNPKYRYFIEAWKHLPLPVANLVGPWLSRSLG